ncbi:TetR/AcrR family transcriptional regulator [Pararhodospirillum oryzae]|uniref:TetR family transcriptional regulator n=1 Tax=Pararhodospirillum oryzae TaxID=478448 RepID=A0A512H3R9_9PROT|nr:TetR/AcrR family transcriptional regulator [Pararhodospirillum oryzae]GEO80112.1 TetR family transcriptional regulator [Pararhodospirillum oryzae]
MEDAPPPAARRRKEARPQEVLEAALDTFVGRGFAATRMEDVARRAGVAKGTLYLYYASKEALFEAVVQAMLGTTIARLEGDLGESPLSAGDRLRAVAQGMAGIIGDPRRAALPKLVIANAGSFPGLARFYYREVVCRGLGLIGRILAHGVATGEFRAIDPTVHARLFVAPVLMGAVWQTTFAAVEETSVPPADLLHAHVELFLRGLAPGAADAPAGERS